MCTYTDKNSNINTLTVHSPAPNLDDLSKRRIVSDVQIRENITTEVPRRKCENETFRLYEDRENEYERNINFATSRQRIILSRSCNIYFNSTFKSVSDIFS
ncbi:hypothetical protein HZS_945 [Henneguya salminicola]|nr:hypothetical protein HZS_945 [Henneguya salminicola]